MWLKLLLLLLYLAILFFLSRLLEASSWYYGTSYFLSSSVVLDPFSLSVQKLKQLLDNRGVSYSHVVEKHELVELVEASGEPLAEEISDEAISDQESDYQSTNFTCGMHFYEEVEDTKDSVWLVQVIDRDKDSPLLEDKTWREIVAKVKKFGVRTGVFRCALDNRLCIRKGWHSSRLILALPRGNKAKEDVVLHGFALNSSSETILHWVQKKLTTRVKRVQSSVDLEENWIKYSDLSKKSEIRVLLFSVLATPPLFLSSLAVKFTGRVKFGAVQCKKNSDLCDKYFNSSLPVYLIITPEKTFLYGLRHGECLNFKSMEIFLKSLRPEMNDVFLWSFLLVNALAGFELFFIYGQLWKHFVRYFIYVIKYNFMLFLSWLIILTLYQFSFMISFTELSLKLLRIISEMDIAALFRNDWKSFYSYQFLLTTFIIFGSIAGIVMRKLGHLPVENNMSFFSEWFTLSWESHVMAYFFRPMATLSRPATAQDFDFEEGIELLIERLAVPNLWLQPVISTDYIKDLPTWKYKGWCLSDNSVSKENDNQFSSDEEEMVADAAKLPTDTVVSVNNDTPTRNVYFSDTAISPQNSCDAECTSSQQCKNNSATCEKSCDNLYVSNTSNKCDKIRNRSCISVLPKQLHNLKSSDEGSELSDLEQAPSGMLEIHECSICLEQYRYNDILCGLPCGHSYHCNCIMLWLYRDNHCCPICRWPSYKHKSQAVSSHIK